MNFLLRNLTWYESDQKIKGDIRIGKGLILETGNLVPKKEEVVIELDDHFVYSGLINAHDHLEMNLYPRLGNPPYQNYLEWSADIYKPTESPIREIEKVNIKDRLLWGGLKNLVSGATTVIHHNPWHRILQKKEFPVNVLKKMAWNHSLAFGKKLEKSFPRNKNTPFIIHAGEGIDATARAEIPKLDSFGLLKKNTVLIHAIALDDEQITLMKNRESSVVWCPSSNLFMFGQTAPIKKLKGVVKLALGTDSTLTGESTLLDELRVSQSTGLATPSEIMKMVTEVPALIFNLPEPKVCVSHMADLLITPICHENYSENLATVRPADLSIVFVKGMPRLFDARIISLKKTKMNLFQLGGQLKVSDVDVIGLKKKINAKVSSEILDSNPLWKLIG